MVKLLARNTLACELTGKVEAIKKANVEPKIF